MSHIRMADADPITALLKSPDTREVIEPTIGAYYVPKGYKGASKIFQSAVLDRIITKFLHNLNNKRVTNSSSINTVDIKPYMSSINDIMVILENPMYKDGKCIFLGNNVDKYTGCKMGGHLHPKLLKFSNIIKTLILDFLRSLSNKTRAEFQLNKDGIEQLTETIKSLIYFVGTKTTSPILPYFSDFFNDLNTLFGDDLIVNNCPAKTKFEGEWDYSCGRYVEIFQCNTTKKYKILVGSTVGYGDNTGNSNSLIKNGSMITEQCGGKRIRKTRKTKKHSKRTVKRKQSKRR
jgi:hypothetical protein